jgi:hypothetical protein
LEEEVGSNTVVAVERNKMDQDDTVVVNKMGGLVVEIEVGDNWKVKYEADVQSFVCDRYL